MATLDDIEVGLAMTLSALLFPGMTYQMSAVGNAVTPYTAAPGAPVLTIPTKLYVGDPNTKLLDADLQAGVAHVTVQRADGYSRDSTRFQPYYIGVSANSPTLNVAVQDNQAILGGIFGVGQVVAIKVGKTCYAYATTSEDSITSVMSVFAAAIPGAAASGAILTTPDAPQAVVVVPQQVLWSTGQQEQVVTVTIYAPPIKTLVPASGALVRAALGGLVNGLKSLRRPNGSVTRWFGLPDGDQAQVEFYSEANNDRPDRADMWLRLVRFKIEYDETVQESGVPVVATLLAANLNGATLSWIGAGVPGSNVITNGQGVMLGDAAGKPFGSAN